MLELELLGLHSDGNSLVLTAEDGSRYTLLINDALRAAVRKDRPHLEAIHAAKTSLGVKDIQVLIRAGASIEEIALTYDISIERLRKYERPIIAERTWAAERALSCRINGDANSPLLGDIVIDRLAARGVDPNFMEWTAIKKSDEPWEIILTFAQGTTERQAHWSMEENGNGIYAIDEEAHWLTETAMPPTIPDIVVPTENNNEILNTQELIEHLNNVRGTHQNADIYGDTTALFQTQTEENNENNTVDNIISLSTIHNQTQHDDNANNLFGILPTNSPISTSPNETENTTPQTLQTPVETTTDTNIELEETQYAIPQIQEETPKPLQKKTTKRQSVPTWDEIVFGGKTK